MRLIKKISKVGTNSLMVVLDKIIVTTLKLKAGDKIEFNIIRKIKRGKNE